MLVQIELVQAKYMCSRVLVRHFQSPDPVSSANIHNHWTRLVKGCPGVRLACAFQEVMLPLPTIEFAVVGIGQAAGTSFGEVVGDGFAAWSSCCHGRLFGNPIIVAMRRRWVHGMRCDLLLLILRLFQYFTSLTSHCTWWRKRKREGADLGVFFLNLGWKKSGVRNKSHRDQALYDKRPAFWCLFHGLTFFCFSSPYSFMTRRINQHLNSPSPQHYREITPVLWVGLAYKKRQTRRAELYAKV